ncbi:copper homeostasis protein CutC [Bacteroidota bacterium]
MIIEACVETYDEAILAEERGADQIELCSELIRDGLTPEKELISRVTSSLSIPVKVMVRPRAGDFMYDLRELESMIETIAFCKDSNVKGVVFGILDTNNEPDMRAIAELAGFARPLEVTIHKAIDLTPDPLHSLRKLLESDNIFSILTSGGKKTAKAGSGVIRQMILLAGDALQIIAAGSITRENLETIHKEIGASAYHGRRIVGRL